MQSRNVDKDLLFTPSTHAMFATAARGGAELSGRSGRAVLSGVLTLTGLVLMFAGSVATARTVAPTITTADQPSAVITEEEAFEIGVEAYHYFYPLISMEITRRVTTNLPAGVKPGLGPANAFHHMREYPTADFREVVRPNFDTLYSSAWLDVSKEPQIISAPDTQGRHYLLPLMDMWSNVFAVPGKRTSGTGAQNWAIVSRGWSGQLPEGVQRIEATTPTMWIIGRTQTNGPSDYAAVHALQDQYKITSLSAWGKPLSAVTFTPDPTVDMKTPPLVQVNTMPADRYFALAAELMVKHPPQLTDWSTVSRLERIGIIPGKPFDFAKAPPQVQSALNRAVKAGLESMKQKLPTLARVANGWQMNTDTMGVYGNAYLKRAIVAMVGLGANQPEDAIYPLCLADDTGEALQGERRYEMRFSKEQLPPVNAFWSITMYDAQGFQVANPLNRFAIGDRDALTYGPDGSLIIYIQHADPGPEKRSNWLPAPAAGTLGITMRLYAPKVPAIDGRWNPPAVQRLR
jgi:hypothetical protein